MGGRPGPAQETNSGHCEASGLGKPSSANDADLFNEHTISTQGHSADGAQEAAGHTCLATELPWGQRWLGDWATSGCGGAPEVPLCWPTHLVNGRHTARKGYRKTVCVLRDRVWG